MKTNLFASVILGLSVAVASTADAGSLRGSPKSMKTQHKVAVDEDMTFLDTPAELRALVDKGILERIEDSDDVTLSGVSFPYARPAVRVFIDTALGAVPRADRGATRRNEPHSSD